MSDLTPAKFSARLPTSGRRPKPAVSAPRQHRDGPLQAEILPGLCQHIPGCKLTGWRTDAMSAFQDAEEVVGVEDDFWDALKSLRLTPDAFVIHKETSELHFFEVEIRHILTDTKLQEYARFLTVMDYYGIKFEVFTVNQHGHINEVHLLPHYVAWLKERLKESKA